MGLMKTLPKEESILGEEIQDAYWQIEDVQTYARFQKASIRVSVSLSRDAVKNNYAEINTSILSPRKMATDAVIDILHMELPYGVIENIPVENHLKAAYQWLKESFPFFSDAQDVLEDAQAL